MARRTYPSQERKQPENSRSWKADRKASNPISVTSNVAKAIDDIMTYTYQYNIKIIGVPLASDRETSLETANLCLKIFNCIGANISISDIDIAHRVQPRNSHRGQGEQPIICKFVRRMAREQVMAVRNNANQQTADDLGLFSSMETGRVAIFCHLNPRL